MISNKEELPLIEKESLQLKEQKIAALSAPSSGLAAYIVAYKVIGVNKEFALFCMEELARRRTLGEDFDFETYIEDNINKMPKIEPLDLKSISGLINIKSINNLLRK